MQPEPMPLAVPPSLRLRAAGMTAQGPLTGLLAFVAFGLVLFAAGKQPLQAYADTARFVLGSLEVFTGLFVRMGPLLLTALAVAIPARINLFNVGGEGQLYMGALTATGTALALAQYPSWLLMPATILAGFAGGAVWALIPAILRVKRVANESITTLLLNYIAPLLVGYMIFGPWRSPDSASFPQSRELAEGARLALLPGTRLHAGLLIAAACVALFAYVLHRTRYGLEMRGIGGNAAACAQLGLPVRTYMLVCMAVGGGVAGLAGMAEVSAIQGRLVGEISPGYGYMGFLVAWLAGPSVGKIVTMALLFAFISSVGDVLQITQGVPFAVVNILMAAILFAVLCGGKPQGAGAMITVIFVATLAASVAAGTSLLYATLGEIVAERAGVINLGLEGVMLVGAASACAAAFSTGNPYWGLVAAMLAGMLVSAVFAYAVVDCAANQLAAGLSLLFLGAGASALIGKPYIGAVIKGLPVLSLRAAVGEGSVALNLDLLVFAALPLTALLAWLLSATRWGLRLRAVGENPAAAYAAGCNRRRLQYQAILLSGALSGLAGAHIALAVAFSWAEWMTGGRGFIAIALVMFARWNPWAAVVGALVFGGTEALQLQLQANGMDVSPFLMNMLPYLLTLAALPFTGKAGRLAAPAWLGRPFFGVE